MLHSAQDVYLSELKDTISQLNITISQLHKYLEEKEITIAELKAELSLLRQKLYGSSKERLNISSDASQLNFFDAFEANLEPEPIPEIIDAEFIEVTYKKAKKKKPTLEEQFKDIPVKQIKVVTLTEEDKTCDVCGAEMKPIGTEVIRREVIHVKPQLYMVEYIATTYECPTCKDTEDPQFIKDDSAPKALIEGSYVSPSLASHVLHEKFVKSVPFYRLEKSFEELGAQITRTSMANWAIKCSQMYFAPMTNFFHRKLLERKYLMMDETPIQVLNEPGKRAESKSYVWLMRSGEDGLEPIVYYYYADTRSGEIAKKLLDGIGEGVYMMADGFTGYNKVTDIKRCACYAHIRRYLYEAIPKGKGNDVTEPAVQGVLYCNKLFDCERRYREMNLKPETRKKRRLKEEKPIVEAFLAWANKQQPVSNGKFAKAITYIKNRSKDMMTYLEDGCCSLSNNPSENSIRPVTVGRKNWLFCTSVEGAEASANIYTIVEMAKLHGLSSYKYLELLLEARPNENMSDEELEALAPWNPEVKARCSKSVEEI